MRMTTEVPIEPTECRPTSRHGREFVDSLPEALVGTAMRTIIGRLFDSLCPFPESLFEARMVEGRDDVDTVVPCTITNGGLRLLESFESSPAGLFLRRDPTWRGTFAFVRRLLHENETDGREARLWLEFDSVPERFGRPCFFVDGDRHRTDVALRRLAVALLYLGRRPLSGPMARAACRLVDEVPPGAYVDSWGIMSARETHPLRVSIVSDTVAAVEFLGRLRLEESARALAPLIPPLAGFASQCMIDLDVADALESKVGFEVKPDDEGDWPHLRDVLVEAAMVDARKFDALLDWRTRSDSVADVRRSFGIGFEGAMRESTETLRRINHVKLVFDDGVPIDSKVYFSVRRF